ncbi:HD-GYP domain-containing protein [Emcibacter nanhaiensis]|uniref:HD domain-containing protein n=1 Tax=Emcibacter nanhaiensis TaxID=1505037 RepID=A0A501PB75_9PROT|nr:HD domain-containing phosphohydrolase [Emcibacter nanhaiensis]TPD57600.1 HD domain-containing protein [Emcibacter nanhaiensis]
MKNKKPAAAEMLQTDEIVKDTLLHVTGLSDLYTQEHLVMVAELAARIAERLSVLPGEIEKIKLAAHLHDIGKHAVPGALLAKPGKLTHHEYELVKTHVDVGTGLLEKLNVSQEVIRMVGEHHERLDGSGYPRGLRGDEISLGGQIIGVADVISALMSKRTYRTAAGTREVGQILMSHTPHQMAPEVVLAALDCLESNVDEVFTLTDQVGDLLDEGRRYH